MRVRALARNMRMLLTALLLLGACEVASAPTASIGEVQSPLETCEAERLLGIDDATSIWEAVEVERRAGECRMLLIEDRCHSECERAVYECTTYRLTELARQNGRVITRGCSNQHEACVQACETAQP